MKTKTAEEIDDMLMMASGFILTRQLDQYFDVVELDLIALEMSKFATQQVTAATEEIKRERDEYYDTLQEYRLKTADMEKRIQELEAQVPKWISVEERLPKSGVSVLMLGPSIDIQVGFYIGNDRWDTFYQKRLISITHWMPLPQPIK